MRSSDLLTYFPLGLSLGMGALAQAEMAKCLAGWGWNRNSLGQDPCKVGSMLDADCRGTVNYSYAKLEKDQYYVSPNKNHTGDMECDCNTVMYSLIMACATCQSGASYSWDTWSSGCDGVYIKQYPHDYPQGTAVPHWAFFDVTTLPGGTYSNSNAESVGRDPEALPRKPTAKPTQSGAGGNISSGRNIGAIAGGVVGGLTALVIIIIVFFFVRHGRKNRGRDSQPQYQPQEVPGNSQHTSQTPPTYDQSVLSGSTLVPSGPFPPYNPGDAPSYPLPTGMYQKDPTTTLRPMAYVASTSNYPDRR